MEQVDICNCTAAISSFHADRAPPRTLSWLAHCYHSFCLEEALTHASAARCIWDMAAAALMQGNGELEGDLPEPTNWLEEMIGPALPEVL